MALYRLNLIEYILIIDFSIEEQDLTDNRYLGPYDYGEVQTFILRSKTAVADLEAIIDEADRELSDRKRTAQHSRMASVFSGTGESVCFNDFILSNRDRKEMTEPQFGQGEGIDFLAYYVPKHYGNDKTGIYFRLKRILAMVKNSKVDLHLLVEAIMVHELFHYYVDHLLDDDPAYKAHACTPWCRLEEAAANFVAWMHIKRQQGSTPIIAELFAQYPGSGGLKGYGEYHLLDTRIMTEILPLKFKASGCVLPAKFKDTMTTRLDAPIQQGIILWKGMLSSLDEGRIPFFVDLE